MSVTQAFQEFHLAEIDKGILFSVTDINTGSPSPSVLRAMLEEEMPSQSVLRLTSRDPKAATKTINELCGAGMRIGLESEGLPFFYKARTDGDNHKLEIYRR